eukprot:7381538-Prymnesium_polylepis.2
MQNEGVRQAGEDERPLRGDGEWVRLELQLHRRRRLAAAVQSDRRRELEEDERLRAARAALEQYLPRSDRLNRRLDRHRVLGQVAALVALGTQPHARARPARRLLRLRRAGRRIGDRVSSHPSAASHAGVARLRLLPPLRTAQRARIRPALGVARAAQVERPFARPRDRARRQRHGGKAAQLGGVSAAVGREALELEAAHRQPAVVLVHCTEARREAGLRARARVLEHRVAVESIDHLEPCRRRQAEHLALIHH